MLLGLDNLQKPTLIGPPSGIPNEFYGPYWIWLISAALTISRDPRFVTFFVEAIPYFVIFPFVLYRFSKILKKEIVLMIFVVFTFSFNYKFFLWNPHLAPLFYLSFVYMLLKSDFISLKPLNIVWIGLSGFLLGLVMNFHLSFGLGLMVSSVFVFIIEFLVNIKQYKKNLLKNILTRSLFS